MGLFGNLFKGPQVDMAKVMPTVRKCAPCSIKR